MNPEIASINVCNLQFSAIFHPFLCPSHICTHSKGSSAQLPAKKGKKTSQGFLTPKLSVSETLRPPGHLRQILHFSPLKRRTRAITLEGYLPEFLGGLTAGQLAQNIVVGCFFFSSEFTPPPSQNRSLLQINLLQIYLICILPWHMDDPGAERVWELSCWHATNEGSNCSSY